jgi:predicted  nucleic acid-binding Zn-ribbon protein
MSVTKQLLELFRVDKQLRGLKSRLEAAERFHNQQATLLGDLDKQKSQLETQLKQLKANIANEDGEAARLDARIAILREQMNSAKTAKEYNAFLSELNNYKTEKQAAEEREMEAMQKAEDIEKQLAASQTQHAERAKIVATAKADRDQKAADIKDRVTELSSQRDKLAEAIPKSERKSFEDLLKLRGDDAMAPVEVLDRRAHEYSCSSCMMTVTVETANSLISGKLVNCPNCRCLLYIEEDTLAAATAAPKKKGKSKEVASKA